MILKETTFTHEAFKDKLTNAEINTYLELATHMSEDNLLYLYQKSKRHETTIEQVANKLGVTKAVIQDRLSFIIKKQDTLNYFIYRVKLGIKGEYFFSPELVLKHEHNYETIYRSIIPKLEKQLSSL